METRRGVGESRAVFGENPEGWQEVLDRGAPTHPHPHPHTHLASFSPQPPGRGGATPHCADLHAGWEGSEPAQVSVPGRAGWLAGPQTAAWTSPPGEHEETEVRREALKPGLAQPLSGSLASEMTLSPGGLTRRPRPTCSLAGRGCALAHCGRGRGRPLPGVCPPLCLGCPPRLPRVHSSPTLRTWLR